MFVVATYVFAPFPIIIFGSGGNDCDRAGTMHYWAWFTSGWIFVFSFGIPVVLANVAVIGWGNAWLSIAASITFYGSMLLIECFAAKS